MRSKHNPDVRRSGFLVGLPCAFAGSALLTVVEFVRDAIEKKDIFPDGYLILFIIGCIVFLIPSGIGGTILGLLLQNNFRKGSLTPKSATQTGILLFGLAGTMICIVLILFVMFTPVHNYSLKLVKFNLHIFLARAIYSGPEILAGITIACVAGGWVGKALAKQLLMANH